MMRKRILSILLTVMLLVSMIPFAAIPVAAADTYQSYTANSDVSGTDFIKNLNLGGENLYIDLQGHTWTLTEEVDTYDLGIGCLRIENGTVKTSGMEGKYGFDIWGGLVLDNVKFQSCNCYNLFYFGSTYYGLPKCDISNCSFTNCTFTGNGGVFYFNYNSAHIGITVRYSDFIGCKTSGYGSVMYFNDVENGVNVNLVGCNFLDCHADYDGGVFYINHDNVNIDNYENEEKSLFYRCMSNGDGGAIFDDNGYGSIKDCVFNNCYAYGSYGGGAILLNYNNRTIENCEFYGCMTPNSKGLALYVYRSGCTMNSCTFALHESYKGACYFDAACTANNCIFYDKTNFDGVTPTLNNCALRGRSYRFNVGAVNYDASGNLIRGDSPENPILISTLEDFHAMLFNVQSDSQVQSDFDWDAKYYRLTADINGVYLGGGMQDNKLMGDGHTVTTRLPRSFKPAGIWLSKDGYCPGLIEQGKNGFYRESFLTQDATWTNAAGQKVSGKAYVISKTQSIGTFEDGKAYIVTENLTRSDTPIKVKGSAVLILPDGVTFTLKDGARIDLTEGNTLTISGSTGIDKEKMGKLVINATGCDTAIGSTSHDYMVESGWVETAWNEGYWTYGIDAENAGTMNVFGGRIILSSERGPAFGGGRGSDLNLSDSSSAGNGGNGGWLNVYGGWLTASSGWHAVYGGSKGDGAYQRNGYGWKTGTKTVVTCGNGVSVRAGSDSDHTAVLPANNLGTETFVEFFSGVASEYTVTYNVQYDNSKNFTSKVKYMDHAVDEKPTREGYDIAGWYTDAACTKLFDFKNTPINSNITLYAKWAAQERTVLFDMQYDSSKNVTKIVHYNEKVEEYYPAKREGYAFGGWYYDAACTKPFDFNNTRIFTNIHLYAKWTGDCTVVFNVQYDDDKNIIRTTGPGETVDSVTPDARPGYTFDGWYTTAACTPGTEFDFSTKITKTVTNLYAKWQKDRTVTFNFNDGTTASVTTDVPYKTVVKDIPADPTRQGYTFMGWYTDSVYTKGTKFNFSTSITENMTLYAGWESDKTVIFDFNNGTGEKYTEIVPYNTKSTYTVIPEKENGVFVGWFTSTDSSKGKEFDLSSENITEDITLYAIFAENDDYLAITPGGSETVTISATRNINGGHKIVNLGADRTPEDSATIWYVVSGNCTIEDRMNVTGDVALLICDGCTLNVPGGITLTSGNTLKIYAQTNDSNKAGKLIVSVNTCDAAIGSLATPNVGSGKNAANSAGCGSMYVYSGVVEIENANENGVGFGGGKGGNSPNMGFGSGIIALPIYGQGGNGGAGGTLCLYGGCFSAKGGYKAIGGGLGGSSFMDTASKKGSNGSDTAITIAEGCTLIAGDSTDTAIEVPSYNGEKYMSVIGKGMNAFGFTLSSGNWWIIGAGAVVILGGIAAILIVNRKKKKTV